MSYSLCLLFRVFAAQTEQPFIQMISLLVPPHLPGKPGFQETPASHLGPTCSCVSCVSHLWDESALTCSRLLAGSQRAPARARVDGVKWLRLNPRIDAAQRLLGRWILPLSIQPKRASDSPNGAVRVHMSLNNSSINIQCFHYHHEDGPPLASCEDAGKAAPTARYAPFRPGKAHFSHLEFRPSEDAACLIHESKTERP